MLMFFIVTVVVVYVNVTAVADVVVNAITAVMVIVINAVLVFVFPVAAVEYNCYCYWIAFLHDGFSHIGTTLTF